MAHLSGAAAQAQPAETKPTYSLLYSFQCYDDAHAPVAGLTRDSSGNLYGTTQYGGQDNQGTVYKITPSGTETVLHSFGGVEDGWGLEFAGVTLDSAGNIYGVTYEGGEYGAGIVFKVTPAGQETVLYNFTGGSDGSGPLGTLALDDKTGMLYGTTTFGGYSDDGVVFSLSPAGNETVMYSFGSFPADGQIPKEGLVRDSSGNLYGTTEFGGTQDRGTAFEVSPGGTETVLHDFAGRPSDGAESLGAKLLRDSTGNLFGDTQLGGSKGYGVIFKVTPAGTESVLLNFDTKRGGFGPFDGFIEDAVGNLYGTTSSGGFSSCNPAGTGCGVLFKLSPGGKETVLHVFGGPGDGRVANGGVVRVGDSLYGTLESYGAYGCGAVFKYTP